MSELNAVSAAFLLARSSQRPPLRRLV